MKKFIAVIAATLAFCGAYAADFSFEINEQTETTAPGKPLTVDVTATVPEGYRWAAWTLTAFRNGVPAEFPAALNLESKFSKAKRPEWSYCNIFTKWFVKSDNTLQKKLTIPTTDKWPVGNYKFTIQGLFNKPGVKGYKYKSFKVLFTLELPEADETAAETAGETAE
ncbi:MAG: hypothetical protein IKD23_04350 [Lentisphaeria bacterium]|nr:hypothetical protein [Lentisphaeria bacterium]